MIIIIMSFITKIRLKYSKYYIHVQAKIIKKYRKKHTYIKNYKLKVLKDIFTLT